MSSNIAHDAAASTQIIISGLPSIDGDNIDSEIQRALPLIQTMYPECKDEDIEHVNRFPSPTDDGTWPLVVTFEDSRIPKIMEAVAKANKGKFLWFAPSLARHIRRWNAKQEERCRQKNEDLPENDPTIWETKIVGSIKILRRIPNPDYVAPALPAQTVAGHPTTKKNARPSGPMFRAPRGGTRMQH